MYTKYLFDWSDKIFNKNRPNDNLDGVVCHDDISYGEHSLESADIFYPEGSTDNLKVIFGIHGGGFFGGDKAPIKKIHSHFASLGYFVISINYPLPPKHKFPTPIASIFKALTFFKTYKFNCSPDFSKLILMGDSAGAYQAAITTILINKPDFAKELGLKPACSPSDLCAVLLFCGFYDIKAFLSHKPAFVFKDMIKSYFGYIPNDDDIAKLYLSPINYIDTNFPPAFVAYAEKDPIKCESLTLLNKLNAQNSFVKHFEGKNVNHDFHFDFRKEETRNCLKKAAEFLDEIFN